MMLQMHGQTFWCPLLREYMVKEHPGTCLPAYIHMGPVSLQTTAFHGGVLLCLAVAVISMKIIQSYFHWQIKTPSSLFGIFTAASIFRLFPLPLPSRVALLTESTRYWSKTKCIRSTWANFASTFALTSFSIYLPMVEDDIGFSLLIKAAPSTMVHVTLWCPLNLTWFHGTC